MSDTVSHEPSQPASDQGTRWEIEFYEDILRRNPDYVEVLAVLGGTSWGPGALAAPPADPRYMMGGLRL